MLTFPLRREPETLSMTKLSYNTSTSLPRDFRARSKGLFGLISKQPQSETREGFMRSSLSPVSEFV
jgi:hypothetical protein